MVKLSEMQPFQSGYGSHESGLRPVDLLVDLLAIVNLVELGFKAEFDPLGWKMLSQMRKVAKQGIHVQLNAETGSKGFVWLDDGCVVGNLSLRAATSGATRGKLIGNVVVHPDYRGRGIGRALMQAALESVRTQGGRWVGLEVRADNLVACQLYKSLGFRAVGQTQHLLRPQGLRWPQRPATSVPWRVSAPKDSQVWNALAAAIYAPLQAQVLEMGASGYTFGGFERKFMLWLNRQRESAWLYDNPIARLALHVKTDRRYKFHYLDLLVHPEEMQSGMPLALAKMVQHLGAVGAARLWPVVVYIATQPPLFEALCGMGFVLHRTLDQMVLSL